MRDFGYIEKNQKSSTYDPGLWLRIFRNSSGYKPAISIAIVLSLGVTAAALGLPYLMKTGIDSFITASQLSGQQRIDGLTRIGFLFSLLVIVGFFLTFIQVILLEWVGQSVMHRIRQRLFRHILDLDLAFLNNQPTGRLVTRITNDVQNMYEMFTSVLVTLFNDLLRLIGILIVLFMINARLAALMSLFVPLALILTVVFSQLAREKFRAIRSQLSRLNSFTQESVSGISIIQLFGRQWHWFAKFNELSSEYLARTLSQIRLFAAFMPLTEFLSWLAVALILLYGGNQIIGNTLSIGELVAYIAYMRLFFQPLRELSQKYSIVQSALASAERIFEMLDTAIEITESDTPTRLPSIEGKLDFHHVSFRYDPQVRCIEDVTLSIGSGETVAIVGPTGSGKTTLISLLLRFYDPRQGTITIDNHDISQFRLSDLRTSVGVILQDALILNDTLLANIVMDSERSRAEVQSVLDQSGMAPFIARLEDGLDTVLGDGGRDLSSGEKQLLSFARALCRNPAILVLDEATSFIDSETESILEQAIDRLENRTSIIIAHRLSTVRRADRIVVMAEGRIVEQGSHDELMQRNGHYAELVMLDLLAAVSDAD